MPWTRSGVWTFSPANCRKLDSFSTHAHDRYPTKLEFRNELCLYIIAGSRKHETKLGDDYLFQTKHATTSTCVSLDSRFTISWSACSPYVWDTIPFHLPAPALWCMIDIYDDKDIECLMIWRRQSFSLNFRAVSFVLFSTAGWSRFLAALRDDYLSIR